MPRMARPPNPDPRDPRVPVHDHFSPCGNLVDPGHPDATRAPRPVRPGTPPPERYLFAIDRGRRRTARDILSFVVLPLVGFATTAWLWTSLSALTLLIGLAWTGAGLIYLLFLTRGFRRPTPQLDLKEV
jgi:hypothetical protein